MVVGIDDVELAPGADLHVVGSIEQGVAGGPAVAAEACLAGAGHGGDDLVVVSVEDPVGAGDHPPDPGVVGDVQGPAGDGQPAVHLAYQQGRGGRAAVAGAALSIAVGRAAHHRGDDLARSAVDGAVGAGKHFAHLAAVDEVQAARRVQSQA